MSKTMNLMLELDPIYRTKQETIEFLEELKQDIEKLEEDDENGALFDYEYNIFIEFT